LRKFLVEEIHDLCSLIYIYREREFCWESEKERDIWEDLDVGGRIILKFILYKQDRLAWTG
jgi:hypothetical protein